jgi:hypothetical protein
MIGLVARMGKLEKLKHGGKNLHKSSVDGGFYKTGLREVKCKV